MGRQALNAYLPPSFCKKMIFSFFFTHTAFMPASYTHHLVAAEALSTLPSNVFNVITPHLSLYFFGAQGADFCFFYRFLNPKSKNLGSFLHRKGGYTAFCMLSAFSARDLGLFAYTLGFITHYAADVTFHPFVYAQSGKSPLKHARIEGALDVHFKRQIPLPSKYATLLHRRLTKKEELDLFVAYSAIALKCGFPPLQLPAFSRAISLFNAYPPITSALFPSENSPTFQAALNKENKPWKAPISDVLHKDSADMLFQKSVAYSGELLKEMLQCIQAQKAPPRAWFGKSYLTGL